MQKTCKFANPYITKPYYKKHMQKTCKFANPLMT